MIATATYDRLVRQVAAFSYQGTSREYSLVPAVLPDGARVQAVASRATRGSLAFAIRKHLAVFHDTRRL